MSYLYKELSCHEFIHVFHTHETRSAQFTDEALAALYAYILEIAEQEDEPFKLDVIAICCDWNEYDSEEEAVKETGYDSWDSLEHNLSTVRVDNGHVLVLQ